VNAQGLANGFSLGASTCTSSLAAMASCTVNVNFLPTRAPSVPGALAGALYITSTNGTTPVNLALAGFAFDFSLFVTGASSKTVVQGQTAFYTLAATPLGTTSGTITLACGTLPANAICLFNPAQLKAIPANLTSNIALGISTGKPTSAAKPSAHDPMHTQVKAAAVLTSLLLALPWVLRGRRELSPKKAIYPWISIAALVLTLASITSCAGAGGTIGLTSKGGGTPPGTYPITVTAISNGVTRTAQLTLVVN
jgi:hypothetical protein